MTALQRSKCPDTVVYISDVPEESYTDSERVILKSTWNFVTSHFTAHGFSHIVSSRSMFRSISWLILVLVCMCSMWYLVFGLLSYYFEYPTSFKMEIKQVPSVVFPAVTICPLNPVRDLKQRKQIKDDKTGLNGLLDFYKEVTTSCNSTRQNETNHNRQNETHHNEIKCMNIHPTCVWSELQHECICEVYSFCSTPNCSTHRIEIVSGFYGNEIVYVCRCDPLICEYVATSTCFYTFISGERSSSVASTNSGYYNVNDTSTESVYQSFSRGDNYTTEDLNSTRQSYHEYTKYNYQNNPDVSECVCEYGDNRTVEDLDAASFNQNLDPKQLSFFAFHNDYENLIKTSKSMDLSDVPSTLLYARREDFKMDSETKLAIFVDLIKSCTVNGKVCQYQYFDLSVYQKYGVCFTFNQRGNFRTQSFGTDSGLAIAFTTGDTNSEMYPSINPDSGLRITIHQPGSYPWPTEEGFNVPSGAMTSVAVSLEEVTRLNTVNSGCVESYDLFPNKNYSYTEQACRHHCIEMLVNANCRCYLHPDFFSEINETQLEIKPCASASDMICIDNQTLNLSCEHCLPLCRESIYTPVISSAATNKRFYDFIYMARHFKQNSKAEYCGSVPELNDISGLRIYFPRSRIKTLKEYFTYSEVTFLSNIGGTLGLFFGLSVVGILEALEFVVNSSVEFVKRRGWTKKTEKQPA